MANQEEGKKQKYQPRITFLVNLWLSYRPSGVDSQSLDGDDIAAMSLKCLPASLNFSQPLKTCKLMKNGTGMASSSSGKSCLEWDIVGEEYPMKISIDSMPDLDSLPISTSSYTFDIPCHVRKQETGSCGVAAK